MEISAESETHLADQFSFFGIIQQVWPGFPEQTSTQVWDGSQNHLIPEGWESVFRFFQTGFRL